MKTGCNTTYIARKKFQQISNLILKNEAICLAAYTIVEEMK